jgi:hypothetical protein
MIRNTFCCLLTAAITAIAAVSPGVLSAGESTDSQEYSPARYALIAATVDCASVAPDYGNTTRQVIIKLDSLTGECWVLAMTVDGSDKTRLSLAQWQAIGNMVQNPGSGSENAD